MAKEQKIKDPELQELFSKYCITWGVDKAEDGFPRINVVFPSPDVVSLQKGHCIGCDQETETVLRNPAQKLVHEGVYLRYFNLREWRVKNCPLIAIYQDPEAKDRLYKAILADTDTDETQLNEECIRGLNPGLPQAYLQVTIDSYFSRALGNANVVMRPPLVRTIRTALQG